MKEENKSILYQALELKKKGLDLNQISEELNSKGIKTSLGKEITNQYLSSLFFRSKSLIEAIEPKQEDFLDQIKSLFKKLNDLDFEKKIDLINQIRVELKQYSPFSFEPVDCVIWVKQSKVQANDYNPNSVAPVEMQLLETSILEDGYTQPIVTWDKKECFEVVDGFHRNRVGKESEKVQKRIQGYLPIVIINDGKSNKDDRMASTIRHNRARGKHQIGAMSDIVIELKRRNWSDEKIAKHLGMDADEILRLAQISGLTEMFADREFSQAWEVDSINEDDNLLDSDSGEVSVEAHLS